MFRIALILIAICAIGCKRPNPTPGESIIGQPGVRNALEAIGVTPNLEAFGDGQYCVLSEEWISKVWATELNRVLFDYNARDWKHNRNDCNKFALHGASVASLAFNRDSNLNGVAAAFGIFAYFDRELNDLHTLNFALVGSSNRFEVAFYEPRTRLRKHLSKQEIEMGRAWVP